MDLTAALRYAIDRALDGVSLVDLRLAADRLSRRYRAEIRDGRFHLEDDMAALAYVATRLPATYAAIRAAMAMVTERLPSFAPRHQLDLGAGPGTAFWAAVDCWPDLASALLLEGSGAIRRQGERLVDLARSEDMPERSNHCSVSWQDIDLGHVSATSKLTPSKLTPTKLTPPISTRHDLVTLCYVLDELAPEARQRLIAWAWSQCDGLMLVVEPGTPAGWHRILTARDQLLAAGACMIAPCPHALRCSLLPDATAGAVQENWCHFSRRLARSRLHRLAKQADVPWEDEKFIFIAMARQEITGSDETTASASIDEIDVRIIAPVRAASGRLHLQLCESDGHHRHRIVSKRDGDLYKRARRLAWGERLTIPRETLD